MGTAVHSLLPREDTIDTKLPEQAEHRLSPCPPLVPVNALLVSISDAGEVEADQGRSPFSAEQVSALKPEKQVR